MLYPVDANFSRRRLVWELLQQWPRLGDAPFAILDVIFRRPGLCGGLALLWAGVGLGWSAGLLQAMFGLALFVSSGILGGRWGGWTCMVLGAWWALA